MPTETTDALVARVRRHTKHAVGAWCDECGFEWPCEKAQLLNTLDALRAVRQRGCDCGDDEACLFARERDALRADLARVTQERDAAVAVVAAARNYMAAFGQALDAHGVAYGEQQRTADAALRAALAGTAPTHTEETP